MGKKSTWHPSCTQPYPAKLSAIGLKSQHMRSLCARVLQCQAAYWSIMATESVVMSNVHQSKPSTWFLPREHGATAMLFTPIVCAAVLSRAWHWAELATLTAAFAALAAKDPMVVSGPPAFRLETVAPRNRRRHSLVCQLDHPPRLEWNRSSRHLALCCDRLSRLRRRHLLSARHRHQRKEPPALNPLSNRQRLRSHVKLAGHVTLSHWHDRSLVLAACGSCLPCRPPQESW